MKERILELLNKHHSLTKDELVNYLGVENEAVLKELDELEEHYKIYHSRNRYFDLESNNLGIGVFTSDSHGNYYLDHVVFDYNKKSADTLALMNNDVVLYRISKSGKKIIERVLKHAYSELLGIIKNGKFEAINPYFKQAFKLKGNPSLYQTRHLYKAVISDYHQREVVVIEDVGDAYNLNHQINNLLKLKNVEIDFNSQIKDEVSNFKDEIKLIDYPDYQDFTAYEFVTIDGDSAKDFDDAIAIDKHNDNYILSVAIADVSNYVRVNTALNDEALKRGTSIYFLNRVVPMLPFELSDGLCSLVPDVNRLALVINMTINADGDVIDYCLNKAIIKSKRRLTYKYVNDVLEECVTDEMINTFKMMNDLAHILRNKRQSLGAISFQEDELNFEFEKDKIINISKRVRGQAEMLIEDFMICANETIARIMHQQELPMIYRHHDLPKDENLKTYFNIALRLGYEFKGKHYHQTALSLRNSLEDFENTDLYPLLSDLLLKSMAKAKYTTVKTSHFALALDDYCHFTSPIRRYPDLIVHRMLHKYILDKDYHDFDEDTKELVKIADSCNISEVKAVELERTIDDLAATHYMSKYVGKIFDAVICSVTSFGFFVKLENGVEGLVHIKSLRGYYEFDPETLILNNGSKMYYLGKKVRVILDEVNMLIGKMEFKLAKENKYNYKKGNTHGRNKRNKYKS